MWQLPYISIGSNRKELRHIDPKQHSPKCDVGKTLNKAISGGSRNLSHTLPISDLNVSAYVTLI